MTRPGLTGATHHSGSALTGTHSGFGGLLRQGTVREDVDPDLTATLDVTGHGDTGRLDLTVGDVRGLESLDAVVAERESRCRRWQSQCGAGGAACGT